jgi:hypothetical protein
VVAVTLTKFIVEPFEHIGVGIKRFMLAMVEDVPFVLNPIFLVFGMTLIVLILIFISGYKINICHLIGLEPTRQNPQLTARIHEQDAEVTVYTVY